MAARPVTHILLVTVRDGTTSEQFQEVKAVAVTVTME